MSGEILKKIRKTKNVADLEKLIESGNLASIVEAIRHESLGPKIHSRFVRDTRSSVRFEIAGHSAVAKELLEKLSLDKNQLVRSTAKARLAEAAKGENES